MEKIKIYVTDGVASVISKDAESFEFFKKDGMTVNKNALLTKLIVNYHKSFIDEQNRLFDFLKDKIGGSAALDNKRLDELCARISEKFYDKTAAPNGEKFGNLISLKPTKESEPIIDYIENYLLGGRSLSEYFRNMFASYAALPQDKREEIIFKTQYETLTEAIKAKKRIFLTTTHAANNKFEFAPYALTRAKEELHVYLIGVQKYVTTVRLSRIVSVTVLTTDAEFSEEQLATAAKMIKYGPQFPYKPHEQRVLVELTEKGAEKFKRLYVHRPIPTKVDGNRYYFDCSHWQIVQYFVRFGKDAKVVYPETVRDDVIRFHKKAFLNYGSQRKTETQSEKFIARRK